MAAENHAEEGNSFVSRWCKRPGGGLSRPEGGFRGPASKAAEAAEAAFEVSKQSVSPVTARLQTRLLPLRPLRRSAGAPAPPPASLLPLLPVPNGCEPPIPATNNPSNAGAERPSNGPLPAPHLSCARAQPLIHLQPGREGTAHRQVAGEPFQAGGFPQDHVTPLAVLDVCSLRCRAVGTPQEKKKKKS